jgi:hypothetical protein
MTTTIDLRDAMDVTININGEGEVEVQQGASAKEVVLLSFSQRNEDSFAICGLRTGEASWDSLDEPLHQLVFPKGHELVIRQEGHTVKVIRRYK